ncbi:MAG: DUF2938 family protein [Proteobacteria bacterium]|nr:MAG: DUF2938 family protein [Pseudomonadota bacterium]
MSGVWGFLFQSLVAGVFATFVMDLGATLGAKAGLLVKPNPALLTRWLVRTVTTRKLTAPQPIFAEKPIQNEAQIGVAIHYAIGVLLAAVYFALLLKTGYEGGFWSAVAYGLSTNVFPWLMMFPSMGLGFFGSKAPPQAKLFRTSLVNHIDYGLGLFLASVVLRHFRL